MRPTLASPWWAWATLGGGVVAVAAAVLLWQGNVPAPTDAGQVPAAVTLTTTTEATPRSARPAQTAPTGTGKKASTKAPRAGEPKRLALPALGVTAVVQRVDSINGVLQVPHDVSRVGWWQHSAPPGSATGTTVLDGHIDSATGGPGALFQLVAVNPGDTVTITTTTGATLHYRVQARRVYVKSQGLPAAMFSQQGPPRLVIISCGGIFDANEHGYPDNIAIYATPA